MPTRLYFRNEAHTLSGTLPSTEQSTATATWTATGATTLKQLSPDKGSAQVSHAGTSAASTATQSGLMGRFVSKPLSGAQTVGGGTMILNVAENEGNLASNFWISALHVFVWRPSTNALVGTVRDSGGTSLGGTEPTSASSVQVTHITGITSSAVSAQTGDVIVVEVWARFTQSMGTAYASSFHFGGTTENTTENAVVSNHAAFIELAENLVLTKDVALAGGLSASAASTPSVSQTVKDIELRGVATGFNEVLPAFSVASQDYLIAFAFRDGSTTPPDTPAGWTSLGTRAGTAAAARLAYITGQAFDQPAPDGFTLQATMFGGASMGNITWGNGLFVAVGPAGALYTSPDGVNWTSRTSSFGSVEIYTANYGNEIWVATGASGDIATSTDAITWTQRSSGFDAAAAIYEAVYSKEQNLWVAIANASGAGEIATSTNGTTWTMRTSPFGASGIYGVAFGNGVWVAVGLDGKTATSPDGISWTLNPTLFSPGASIFVVAFVDGVFYTAGAGGNLATSTDGINWTIRNSSFGSSTIGCICKIGKYVVATGITGKMASTSDGGANWTQRSVGFGTTNIAGIAYGNGIAVAVSGTLGKVSTLDVALAVFQNATSVVCNVYRGLDSTTPIGVTASNTGTGTTANLPAVANGPTSFVAGFVGHRSTDVSLDEFPGRWALRVVPTERYTAVAGGNGFVAVGVSQRTYRSNDGVVWTRNTNILPTSSQASIAYGNSLWVLGSIGGDVYSSTDGIVWTARTSNLANTINGIAYDGVGVWVLVAASGGLASSTNGTTWTARTSSFSATTIQAVAYGGSQWVAVGQLGKIATSPDGTNWTQQTSSFSTSGILSVAYGGGVWVAVGQSGKLASSTDGVTWTQRTSGVDSSAVIRQVIYDGSKFIYIASGCRFGTSSNGTTWTVGIIPGVPENTDPYGIAFSGGVYVLLSAPISFDPLSIHSATTVEGAFSVARRALYSDATNEAASYDSGGAVP
jgi:hypothetical protein